MNLSDLAKLIGGKNKSFVSIAKITQQTLNVVANPNRVSVYAVASPDNRNLTYFANFSILDASGAVVFRHTLISTADHIALVTPSSTWCFPFRATLLEFGPLIQQALRIDGLNNVSCSLVELLMIP